MKTEEFKKYAVNTIDTLSKEISFIESKNVKAGNQMNDLVKKNIKKSKDELNELENKLSDFKNGTEEKSESFKESFSEISSRIAEGLNKLSAAINE
jgi:predicted  nucleic acid-binding Zn-ribbon protein